MQQPTAGLENQGKSETGLEDDCEEVRRFPCAVKHSAIIKGDISCRKSQEIPGRSAFADFLLDKYKQRPQYRLANIGHTQQWLA